jgi:cyanate permease
MERKFVIRRAVAGVVIAPLVAGLYVVAVGLLIGLGAGRSVSIETAWSNGWVFGLLSAVAFVVYPAWVTWFERVWR